MKIEIAESLMYSYLKHIEGCRVVQTNWKSSESWVVTKQEEEKAKLLFNKILNSKYFSGIFKNSSFEQLIKQAEIDILGINNVENTIYGIDVAFHYSGLNYGSKEETTFRVLKKTFRTILIMQTFFSEQNKFCVYFITPKVNNEIKNSINVLIEEATNIINDESISIYFISNEEFFEKIVTPLIENTEKEHDTTELFLRSTKLLNLNKYNNTSNVKSSKKTKPSLTKKTINGMKIGQFVRNAFNEAFEQNLISDTEISNLQNLEYSKEQFDSNYEILRSIDKDRLDDNGYPRYYKNKYFKDNYYLTNDWYERQWDNLLAWLDKIGYNY